MQESGLESESMQRASIRDTEVYAKKAWGKILAQADVNLDGKITKDAFMKCM
jgi:hypothetical protein